MPGPSRVTTGAAVRQRVDGAPEPAAGAERGAVRAVAPGLLRPLVAVLVLVLLAVVLLVVVLGAALLAGPAAAAERTVTVTSGGVQPQVLTVAPGDTVRFVVEDDTFGYRAESTGGSWQFDSGPVELLSGEYVVPTPLEAAGTYTYRVAQDPPFHGTVLVVGDGASPGPVPAPSPSGSAAPADPPSATGAPTDAPAGPSPAAAAGSGSASSPLGQRSTLRALGLPAALALLLAVGTASLLLRTLLAEPVLSDPRATLRADGGRRPRW